MPTENEPPGAAGAPEGHYSLGSDRVRADFAHQLQLGSMKVTIKDIVAVGGYASSSTHSSHRSARSNGHTQTCSTRRVSETAELSQTLQWTRRCSGLWDKAPRPRDPARRLPRAGHRTALHRPHCLEQAHRPTSDLPSRPTLTRPRLPSHHGALHRRSVTMSPSITFGHFLSSACHCFFPW